MQCPSAAIAKAYESAAERLHGMTLDQFASAIDECDVHPVEIDGEVVGAVLVSGPEIHACVVANAHGRWVSRRHLALLNRVIKQHGYALTDATTEAGRQFVQRLGFTETAHGYRKEAPWASNH